jgi:hypothetical protein
MKGPRAMKTAKDYEIINHGIENSQYFQGCGTSFTGFDIAITGVGYNAKQAYNDAVDQCYMMDIDSASLDKLLPVRPRGINAKDKVPYEYSKHEDNEIYYYVSIRLKLKG